MADVDRFEKLDPAERWFADIFSHAPKPGFLVAVEVDMTRARDLIGQARAGAVRLTYGHLVVRAAALAMHRMGEAHAMTERERRYIPGVVDVSVPVAGSGIRIAPGTMVLRDAGRKKLPEIARSMAETAEAIRESKADDISKLRKLGLLLNRPFLRAAAIRRAMRSALWRRRYMGTLQVTILKDADFGAALTPFSGVIVSAAKVRDGVAVEEGKAVVRPLMNLACCVDHRVWDGVTAMRFLTGMKDILIDGTLAAELEMP